MSSEHAVDLANFVRAARNAFVPLFDPDSLIAQAFNLFVTMGNDKNGHAVFFNKRLDTSLALLLEHEVTNGEHFVYDKDLGNYYGCDCKCNTSHHARGIVLQWHIEEVLDFSKINDFIKVLFNEFL